VSLARTAVEKAAGEGLKAFYVEAIPGGDRAAYELMADLIPEERFLPFSHIWTHGLPLSDSETWVTSRFPFHLLAAAAGARGIAVGMKKGYYDVKHESVAALGSGWALAMDGDEPPMPQHSGSLKADLASLVAQKRAEAAKIYPRLEARSSPRSSNATKLLGMALGTTRRNKVRHGAN
jgi:hypothetical protein